MITIIYGCYSYSAENETTSGIKNGILTTELLPGIEFSRCITKIYVRSLSK